MNRFKKPFIRAVVLELPKTRKTSIVSKGWQRALRTEGKKEDWVYLKEGPPPPVSLQNLRESKASEASSMAITAFLNISSFPLSHPIDGLSTILHCKPLRNISKWLEIALDQGFNKVTSFILGVSIRNIHHIWLDHQSPRSSVNDLRMERYDRRVVLKNKIWLKKKQYSWV